jgi:hypothetical protein
LGIDSDTHARQTGQMMLELEALFLKEQPDVVLVYGDTNSTLAAALTAVKLHIPVAHVEAGPRINDKTIPEEVNRVVTDHISSMLFAPTPVYLDNLHREGLNQGVYLTGDVMLDCFLHFSKEAEKRTEILDNLSLDQSNYLLATVHRASNRYRGELTGNLQSFYRACTRNRVGLPCSPANCKVSEALRCVKRTKIGGLAMSNFILRNFMYLDTQLLEDYLLAIKGELYEEETIVEKEEHIGGGLIGAKVAGIGGEGKKEKTTGREVRKRVKMTESALFHELYSILESEQAFSYYEAITPDIWDNIKRNFLLEVNVSARFSMLDSLTDLLEQIESLTNLVETTTGQNMIDAQAAEAIKGLKGLGEMQSNKGVPCVQ